MVSARGSFSNAPLYYSVNVGGFANLLIALKGPRYASIRVILASTGTVYGGLRAEDVSEDAFLQPIGPYAETKIAAERLLATEIEHGGLGSGTALRMFGMSGCFQRFVDRDSERMLPKLMRVAAGRAPFFQVNGDGSAVREILDIRDFVVACEQCIDNSDLQYDVVNIGGGARMSVKDAVTLVRNASGRDLDVRFGAEAAEQKITTANITRARDMLGWKPSRLDPERMISDAWQAFISGE
jgi:UDP-glucose 4-epimerase